MYLLKLEYLNHFNREGLSATQLQEMRWNRFCMETIQRREERNARIIQEAIDEAQGPQSLKKPPSLLTLFAWLDLEENDSLSDVPTHFAWEEEEHEDNEIIEDEQIEVLLTSHDAGDFNSYKL